MRGCAWCEEHGHRSHRNNALMDDACPAAYEAKRERERRKYDRKANDWIWRAERQMRDSRNGRRARITKAEERHPELQEVTSQDANTTRPT